MILLINNQEDSLQYNLQNWIKSKLKHFLMMLIFCSLSSIVILKTFVILPLNRPKNGHVLDTQQSYRGSPSTLDTRNLVRLCWVSHLRLMIKQPESQFDYVDKIFVIYLAWKFFFYNHDCFIGKKGRTFLR